MKIARQSLSQLFFLNEEKKQHFLALDGLRGVAVLFVLLSHSSNEDLFFHEHLNFQRIGRIGVYLFFILSAYLLDRQIAAALISGNHTKRFWINYFLRRFLRIYPLFFVALIFHATFTYFGFETVINERTDFPLHLLLLRGGSIFWSIPVEFKYYLISPLIMWFCHKYLRWNSYKIMLFFLLISGISALAEWKLELSLISTFRYLPIFLTGTAISIYELIRKRPTPKKRMMSRLIDVSGVLSSIVVFASAPYFLTIILGRSVDIHEAKYFFPYSILWGIVLIAARNGKGIVERILKLKILRFFGAISFSLYLFHMPVLQLIVSQSDVPHTIKIYLFFFVSIFLSCITYLLVEKPLFKIKIYDNAFHQGVIATDKQTEV